MATEPHNAQVRRPSGGRAILLAKGLIDNDPISIVVSALFLPFLAEVLAVAFGLLTRNGPLLWHGVRALALSTVIAFAGGLVVGAIRGGPVHFTSFQGHWTSFAISAAIGFTAGLSMADDTGRRYLIGVAAAVQLAIFPAWFGAVSATHSAALSIVQTRLVSFAINLATLTVTAAAGYAVLHRRGGMGTAGPLRHG